MQVFAIVLLSIAAAVVYGIIHDQITARICVEYFTIGHVPVLSGTENPTVLGFAWGIIATWWMGVIIGIPLAIAARAGSRPKRSAANLIRPIAILLAVMGVCAILAGLMGWYLAASGSIHLAQPWYHRVPQEKHVAFQIDLYAHSASYLSGYFGGIVLFIRTWQLRSPETVRTSTTRPIR